MPPSISGRPVSIRWVSQPCPIRNEIISFLGQSLSGELKSGGGFQRVPKEPIKFMNNDDLKTTLLADRVGKQFFESLALFQICGRLIGLPQDILLLQCSRAFRPFAACAQLCLDRISLHLLLGRDPRLNNRCLLLSSCYIMPMHFTQNSELEKDTWLQRV